MRIMMVDGYEYDIFSKDVKLVETVNENLLAHFGRIP